MFRRPAAYRCPSFNHHLAEGKLKVLKADSTTNYAVILGRDTLFGSLEDGEEDTSQATTLIATEIGPPCIAWTEPRDVHVAETYARLNPHVESHLNHPGGANFLATDASVRFVQQSASRRELTAWMTTASE